MLSVNVRGGTNAGHRIVRLVATTDWKCPNCGARNRYYWLRCPVCSHPRDAD